jgi:glycosyltransferase involved in cell wall biosynthesis
VGENRYRVVYLDHVAIESGAELALARLLPALDEVEATVILAESGPLVARLEAAGAEVSVLPMGEARNFRRGAVVPGIDVARAAVSTATYTLRLAAELRRIRPDLVVTNSLKAALYGCPAARLARVPAVWHLHDRIARDYLPGPAVRMVQLAASTLPARIIANSETTKATLTGRGRQRADVVGNACPVRARDRDRASGGPLTVGIVGRLAPWKGQDVFLDAFARVFAGSDVRGVIVGGALFGEEQYAAQLEAQVERLGLRAQIRFTGHLDEPWPEMAELDVLVHASIVPEPFGQVIVEGMALGACVIAAGQGGPAELIRPGQDGLLYPPGDGAALADALRTVAGDPALRARLQAAGPAQALRFTPATVAAEEQAVYRAVLGR